MKAELILVKPMVTEKTSRLVNDNVYAFVVSRFANKHQVRDALVNLYGVEVGNVTIMNRKGKVKKAGKKQLLKQRPTLKVAYVTLTKGSLNVFPKV